MFDGYNEKLVLIGKRSHALTRKIFWIKTLLYHAVLHFHNTLLILSITH